jgi:UTP--glucose-1-phosphate uridylyltransferase.
LVPRNRFAPVKATGDLLALRSDAFEVTADQRLELVPERHGLPPDISLDDRHYKSLAALEAGFAQTAPSLRHCAKLQVEGPWCFEHGVVCQGTVKFTNPHRRSAPVRAGLYHDVTTEL